MPSREKRGGPSKRKSQALPLAAGAAPAPLPVAAVVPPAAGAAPAPPQPAVAGFGPAACCWCGAGSCVTCAPLPMGAPLGWFNVGNFSPLGSQSANPWSGYVNMLQKPQFASTAENICNK
ncbi:hypothetical protein ACP4OV_023060 [Aristida adscensionis]